jgi:hypothetical protein
MSIPIVPHLGLVNLEIPVGTTVVLPSDRHRTYFAVSYTNFDEDAVHIWIGRDPPVNIASWIPLSYDISKKKEFPHGVFGPIYIAVTGSTHGHALIMSNLVEEPTSYPSPTTAQEH